MEQIASLTKLDQCLARIDLVRDHRHLQDLITELHFVYERHRLVGDVFTVSEQRKLWVAAYYLFTSLSNSRRQQELTKEEREDGFGIAGLIFELLGRYSAVLGDTDLEQECYLNASLANTLSRYEANAAVLARKYFREDLPELLRENGSLAEYGRNIVLAFLARQFFWIRSGVQRSLQSFDVGDQSPDVLSNRFSSEDVYWWLVLRAIARFSVFVIDGHEGSLRSAISDLISSRKQSLEHDMLFEHWLSSRLLDCANRIVMRSTWKVLREHGFSDQYIGTLTRLPQNAVHELWESQIAALTKVESPDFPRMKNSLSDSVKRLIVSMPTSAGKTLIAEMAVVRSLERNPGSKCVYVAPSRALVDELETKLRRRLRLLGYRVASVVGGFEIDIADENYLNENIDVAVLTPEKFDYLLRKRDPFVSNLCLVIFDEVHKVSEGYRGWFLESLITWLLLKPELSEVKMIFMSAVLPRSQEPLVRMWLGDQALAPIISTSWSPTRRVVGILWYQKLTVNWRRPVDVDADGNRCYDESSANLTFRYDIGTQSRTVDGLYKLQFWVNSDFKRIRGDKETRYDRCYKLVQRLNSADSVLVYFQEKVDLVRFCSHAREYLPLVESPILTELTAYVSRRLGAAFPLVQSLPYGVAFHHGDLPFDVRLEIEQAYRDKAIRVLACTTSLAEGVNLPIHTFILGYHQTWGGHRLSMRDFANIIGRSGRALVETEGRVIAIRHPEFSGNDENSKYWGRLIDCGEDDYLIKSELTASVALQDADSLVVELNALADAIEDADALAQQEYTGALADRIQRLQVLIFSLYEDGIITDEVSSIEGALQRTLCFQQPIADNLRHATVRLGQSYYSVCRSMDSGRLRRFNRSGLRYRSNYLLEQLAAKVVERGNRVAPLDYSFEHLITAQELAFVLDSIEEAALKPHEFSRHYTIVESVDHYSILLDWLRGVDFVQLRDRYFSDIPDVATRTQICQGYISKQFTYRLPWVLSGLHTHTEPFGNESLSFWFSTLPAQVKYGVNTPEAVYLSSVGVYARFLAVALAQLYREEYGVIQESVWQPLAEWFRGLSPFYLSSMLPDLPMLAIRQAIRRANAIRPPGREIRTKGSIFFDIAGWQYYEGEQVLDQLQQEAIGYLKPTVNLQIEPENIYDEYAVEIYWHGHKLGYVPRQHNEEVALLLTFSERIDARVFTIGPPRTRGGRSVQVMFRLLDNEGLLWQ